MFEQTLLPDTLRAIQLVSKYPVIKSAYLAGGTALSLQMGHRISVDLDFFTAEEFDEKVLCTTLEREGTFKKTRTDWGTVLGYIGETKFSLFYYKYPLIEEPVEFSGLKLASKQDIAAMKLLALTDRGVKRDFIDLYELCREYSLEQVFKFYERKYSGLDEKMFTILKSLNYFEDAENDDWMPRMVMKVDWVEVKSFFEGEAKRLAEKYLE